MMQINSSVCDKKNKFYLKKTQSTISRYSWFVVSPAMQYIF